MTSSCPEPASAAGDTHNASGHIRFLVTQSASASPSALRVRAAFERPDGEPLEVPLVGYHELVVKISDPLLTPSLARRPLLDTRVEEILRRIDAEASGVDAIAPG